MNILWDWGLKTTSRKIAKILAELEEALVQEGMEPEDAKSLVDGFEDEIEDEDDETQEE